MNKLNRILLDNRNNIESSAEKCPFCHGENDRCEYFTTVESRLGQLGSYQINDCLTQELLEQIKERLRGETVEVWDETGEIVIDLAKSLVLIKPAIGLYHVLAELPLVGRIIRSLARDMGLNLEDLELWWERNFQIIFNAIAVSHPALKEKLVDRDFNMEIFNRCRTALRAINKELDTAQEISVFAVADWGKRIDTKPDFTGMVICGPVEVLKLEDYVYRRLIDFEERLLTQVNGIQYECAHWKELRLAFLDEWEVKYFRTKFGKELKFTDKEILITGKDNEILIRLNEDDGIEIQSAKKVMISSAGELTIHSDSKVNLQAGTGLELVCNGSSITMDGVTHIKGKQIKTN